MNHESDDAMFDVLLTEAVGGPRPPDLSAQILQALQAGSAKPAGTDSAAAAPSEIDAPLTTAPSIVAPAAAPHTRRRTTVYVTVAWLASLAASVLLGGLFFHRFSEPITRNERPPARSAHPAAAIPAGTQTPAGPEGPTAAGDGGPSIATSRDDRPPEPDFRVTSESIPFRDGLADSAAAVSASPAAAPAIVFPSPPQPLSDEAIVARINTLLQSAWQSSGIEATAEVDATIWNARLSRLLDTPIAVAPTGAGSTTGAGTSGNPSDAIRRSLADVPARRSLARRFAGTLLGRVGAGRLSEAQREAFANWLAPAVGGDVRFDTVAGKLLTARGSSDPEAADFNPATIWLTSLAGPHSVPLVEQFGHAMLDVDLRCGRCHDHPLDGRVWQNQYWGLNAVFQTSLRWSTGEGGALRVDTVPPSARSAEAVVFFELPDGRQRAVPPRTASEWIAGAATDTESVASQAGELAGLAAALQDNPQLARAAINRLWETVYGGPLVGSAADPSAPPESDALLQLQSELAEQLRAYDFDLSRAVSWIAAAAPLRRQTPEPLGPEGYELASDADLRHAAEQIRSYAGYPPELPKQQFSGLVAMVQRWNGDPGALGSRPNVLLGQIGGTDSPRLGPQSPAATPPPGGTAAGSTVASERILRASFESATATPPLEWLAEVGAGDAFDQRARHLFYLAGYWNPSGQQMDAAAALRAGVADEAVALHRLWWILSRERLF